MTMASLTASLLTRQKGDRPPRLASRQAVHPASHAPVGSAPAFPADRAAPPGGVPAPDTPSPVAVTVLTGHTKRRAAEPAAPLKTAVPRKSKTLRLDPKTDLRLRLTAARLGVTQQSIMERGLKALLDKTSPDGHCLCGLTDKTQDGG